MTIEARKPPPQFVFRLKRALGGRAGWTGFALQILFVAALVWIGYEIVANACANLEAQRITSGFGFLNNTAGFLDHPSPISQYGFRLHYPDILLRLLHRPLGALNGVLFRPMPGIFWVPGARVTDCL